MVIQILKCSFLMQALEPPRADAAGDAESAWERGLRQAKEVYLFPSHYVCTS